MSRPDPNSHMQGLEHLLQSFLRRGNRNKVHMVGHQTVSENFHAVIFRVRLQPVQINLPVVIGKKHVLAAVAALRDMVRHVCKNISGKSGHAEF